MSSYQKPGYKKKYNVKRFKRKIYKYGYKALKSFHKDPLQFANNTAAVWEAINKIRGMINCELHKFEVNTSSQTVPYVGTTVNYSSFVNIGQGDTEETRTGNSILLKYVTLQGLVRNASSNPAPAVRIRLIILEDTQEVVDNATSYNLSQILEYSNSANAITSPLSSDYIGRFKILLNRVFSLDTVRNVQRSFKFFIPMPMKHVRYNGTASSDIQKRNVFWLIFADNDPSSGSMYSNPIYNIQTRTAFYDN